MLDYICDWARDIYRPDVLRCLAGGDMDARDATPAYTIISSLTDDSNGVPDSPLISTPRAASPEKPSLIDLTLGIEDYDLEMEDARLIGHDLEMEDAHLIGQDLPSLTSTDPADQHPLLRFSSIHHHPKHWSKHATIRHANLVLFSFRHFAIPEDSQALVAWLNSFSLPRGIARFAQTLSQEIERSNAVTITMNGVLQLENLWTRSTHQPSSDNDDPILAWIYFDSYLRSSDWQVVRELSCVTASQSAIKKLMTIAGIPLSSSSIDWTAHRCHCLTTDAQSLRSLCGKDSTISAALILRLQLQSFVHANDEVHFRWTKESDTEDEAVRRAGLRLRSSVDPDNFFQGQISGLRNRDLYEELLSGSLMPPFLLPFMRTPWRFGAKDAVLLKKTPLWFAASCPQYCLMVFDETGFDDEPALARKVIRLSDTGDVYVLESNELHRAAVSGNEKCAFRVWADILSGKIATDVPWPS